MKLVEQLQSEALDAATSVSMLLRKVKLVAAKLRLAQVDDWVGHELNGYDGELPEYRCIGGRPQAFNPYNGWIPIIGNADFISIISEVKVSEPISALESLVSEKGSHFHKPYSPHQMQIILQNSAIQWPRMGIEVARSQLVEVIDRVRTLVLDWALELEHQGILGNEIGFNDVEKRRAQDGDVHIHIGSIGSFSGAISSNVAGSNSRSVIGSTDRSRNRSG